jgi:hypothetical protein
VTTVHYLAYGSNLHPLRLGARIDAPRVIGVVELPGYCLAFHKRGMDGSGKCLFYDEVDRTQRVYGVLYAIEGRLAADLDALEGPGYRRQHLSVAVAGRTYAPYLYAAAPEHRDPGLVPYHWYKGLVLAGARYHGLPADYLAAIDAIPSLPDPNPGRSRDNERLLARLRASLPE